MRTLIVCSLIIGALSATSAGAGEFTGVALDLSNDGIEGVLVEAIGANGDVTVKTTTGKDGRYTLSGIPATGAIRVRFSKIGRIGTTLERLSSATVAGKMDVVMPEASPVCGTCRGAARPLATHYSPAALLPPNPDTSGDGHAWVWGR